MMYVSHAWPHAILRLADQLRGKGYTEDHSYSKVKDRYELVTDAPKWAVEILIYDAPFPKEALDKAYEVEEI